MLKRYATFVSLFRSASDICIVACVWLSVFYIRFYSGAFAASKGVPDFKRHLVLTLPIVLICYLGCQFAGLYRTKRTRNMLVQFADILKASVFSGLLVVAFLYYLQEIPYSRTLLALFAVMLFAGLVFSHLLIMAVMRNLRKKGYNLRYYAVIGAGSKGQQLVQDIDRTGWLGLRCAFFVEDNP